MQSHAQAVTSLRKEKRSGARSQISSPIPQIVEYDSKIG